MAKRLLFVHGTGVRRDGYEQNFSVINKRISEHSLGVTAEPCLWGEEVGARLHHDGASIPTYGETRSGAIELSREEALWPLLLQDPTFELELLADPHGQSVVRPPNALQAQQLLLVQFAALHQAGSLRARLNEFALDGFLPVVLDDLERSDGFRHASTSLLAGEPPHRAALARAVVAGLMKASLDSGGAVPDSTVRDDLVANIAGMLGDDARGVFAFFAAPFVSLGKSMVTWYGRRKRGAIMDDTYPSAGDILIYQSRGAAIRGFIRERIEVCGEDDVYLFAHSLGGVAAFELLAESIPPNVKGLITFGSQAAFFYEIGALSTLAYDTPLDDDFPPWINFYNLNDLLSYVGAGMFKGRVRDVRIDGGSFPACHSAYLNSKQLWAEVKEFIDHV